MGKAGPLSSAPPTLGSRAGPGALSPRGAPHPFLAKYRSGYRPCVPPHPLPVKNNFSSPIHRALSVRQAYCSSPQ